jgi:hypothetical protein
VLHHAPRKALVSEGESLCTQCREALLRGMDECERPGAKSWITDLTRDPGVPSQADLKWIEGDGARLLIANGVRAVINVHGGSAVARMGAKRWSKSAADNGVATYDCASIDEALEIAAEVASKAE